MGYCDVSVLVTCFNKEEFLNDCLESIKRQTKTPRDVILVHDGCENPQAHAIAETIILKENNGVAYARERAVHDSNGKLLLFVDGDDVLSPDYIEKMVNVISNGADIAYPDTFLWASRDSKLVELPDELDAKFVTDMQKVVIPISSMMKREVYDKVKGFRKIEVLEDLDFFMRALAEGFIFKKANTLLWYRQIEGTRNKIDYIKRKRLFDEIMSQFVITKEKIAYAQTI